MSRRFRKRHADPQQLGRALVELGRERNNLAPARGSAAPVARPLPSLRQQLIQAGLLKPNATDPERTE